MVGKNSTRRRDNMLQNPNFQGNAGSFFNQNTRSAGDNRAAGQTNVPKRGPRYPQYSMTSIRRGTFQSWPSSIQQDVDIMTEAGFYYTGNNDHVRCFHCGIGLQNWDMEDNPFVEHARWSPDCIYLKEAKGIDFINTVQDALKRVQLEEALHNEGIAETFEDDYEEDGNTGTSELLPSGKAPSKAEKKNPLLTDAAQSLVSLGYLPKVVKLVIDRVLKQKGWTSLSSRVLMEEIYKIEESGEIPRDEMKVPISSKLKEGLYRTRRVYRTPEEVKTLSEKTTEMREQMQCKICCEMIVSIVFLPCGHLTSCSQCAPALKSCPVCRTEIKGTVKVHIQ